MCTLPDEPFDIATAAGWYSAAAGLLAGFAMLAILFPLDHEATSVDERTERAGTNGVIVFTSAFFSLLMLTFSYAILSGRPPGLVAAHEQQLNGAVFGPATLLLLLGLREVLLLYGGNRKMLRPSNTLFACVTGILGPIATVAFGFGNVLDFDVIRASQASVEVTCVAGLPRDVFISALISAAAIVMIVVFPLFGGGRRIGNAASAVIGEATLGFTALVAVWASAVTPFLSVRVLGGEPLELIIVTVSAFSAVVFGATAWLSRAAPGAGAA